MSLSLTFRCQKYVVFGNQYEENTVLRNILHRYLPRDVLQHIERDLLSFGDEVIKGI